MSLVVGGFVLLAAFAVCDWSGRTLAHHYQDRWEMAATLAVGACIVVALALAGTVRGPTAGWPEAVLALAMSAGLFTGYYRSPDAR